MIKLTGSLLFAALLSITAARAESNLKINYPAPTKTYSDTTITEAKGIDGFASFYAKMFEGLKTANGEVFSHNKVSAASNFFPLNTLVRITNLDNGLSVLVRITDRMHPNMTNKGRVVDLSLAAAKKIHMMTSKGLAKVNIQKVEAKDED